MHDDVRNGPRSASGDWGGELRAAVLKHFIAAAPLFVYPVFMMGVLCFALFASAFNLLLGFGGLLSFGHAAYFGMAGYVTAHCAKVWGLPPALSILVLRSSPPWMDSAGITPVISTARSRQCVPSEITRLQTRLRVNSRRGAISNSGTPLMRSNGPLARYPCRTGVPLR